MKQHIHHIGMIMLVLVSLLLSGTAAHCFGDSYTFAPEEIMYLAGTEKTAYKEGLRYSLFDIDKDGISELFLFDDIKSPGKLEIFRYDPQTNSPVSFCTLDDVTEVYGDTLENGLFTVTGNIQKGLYHKYAIVSGSPEEKPILTETGAGSGGLPSAPDNRLQPLTWTGSGQWVDGSIIGTASHAGDPGPQNDFYLSSNYEWLSAVHITPDGEISGGFDDLEQTVSEKKALMFADRENYQGADIQRVRDYYDAASDWDRREAEGIEPVRKYLDAAERVSSLSDLTELLTDPSRSPFCYFLTFTVTLDEKDTSHWAAEIAEDNFSVLPRVYHNRSREEVESVRLDFDIRARHVLTRSGYSAEETEKIMSECYELEEILLPLAWPDEADAESPLYGFVPYETVIRSCENFPLERLLNAYQISGGKIHVWYPGYLKQLDRLYTEENLSVFRSYLLAHTAAAACDYLDLEAASCPEEMTVSDDEMKTILNERYQADVLSRQGLMSVAVENAYMTFFADPETRSDLIGLAEEIRDAFRIRLLNEDWLSDAGKTAAVEKLDAMTFSVMAPDVLIDSSWLAVDKDASFLDNYAQITVSRMKHNGAFAGKPRERGDWRYDLRPEISSTLTNAFYYGCFNQFFILSGFVTDPVRSADMSREEKLASLGQIIGHELTHGFDPDGIRYDKDGNMVISEETPYGWLPESDYHAFMSRAQKIADYFDGIFPFPYESCPGELQWGEAAADIGGIMIGLDIAAKTEGFDYDRYFRAYSAFWRKQSTLAWERSDIHDAHPLNYLRINAALQQFDEFLNTYHVQEGDGMYLAPEDRIRIW